ncbi:MAG: helix-turn-helix domain-containing protein [Phyllobacterium sp.]
MDEDKPEQGMAVAGIITSSARPRPLNSFPDYEVRLFRGALSTSEWVLHGIRNRAIILISGGGVIQIDKYRTALAAPCTIWLPAGRKGMLQLDAGAEGAMLVVSELALGRAIPAGPVTTQIQETIFVPILGLKTSAATARRQHEVIEAMDRELREDLPGAKEAMRHQLALLLIGIWRLSSPTIAKPQPSPRAIVLGFLHLVELHMRDHWTIAEYAAFLGVTTDRLNSAVRRATGKSPLALIHQRLVMEAEFLLDNSTLQISEIAETLGFQDPAYFNRFFKRERGVAPGRRRAEAPMQAGRDQESFAAWP